ncbi:regucalcin-like [Trichoplusia ni]|uniref:Regucalcin n=1 Tax=Trichoplusia ni TaxID=7111 RepID=A0A7E5W839_TRINI|nr:regucalcin-like [Trichoplusia ni]XP_026736806.1 regucalcin-like [Trichoplusia ni]
MAPVVTQVLDPVTLGEGPHWHSEDNALYFISGDDSINKFEPDTGKHVKAKLETLASFILPVEGKKNHFLITQGRKVVEIEWSAGEGSPKILRTITEVDHENPKHMFNDGKADPLGRLFAGTLHSEAKPGSAIPGSLYRIDPDGTTTKLETGIQCSNGMCWDLKEKAFYYIDSFSNAIRRYDYDVATGNISNLTIAFSLTENGLTGCPDGMTIDTDGNLWVAVFWGSNVLKIDPRKKKLLETIEIPVPQVTSVTFGGHNLDILYVTTAGINYADRGMPDPPSGATYAVTGLSARGLPNLKVRLI